MKQTIKLLISALEELQKTSKTQDIIRLEEKVALIIKDLNGLIIETKNSNDDKDLKQNINKLDEVLKNLEQNHEKRSKTYAEFMRYIKDRKIN